MEDKIKPTSSAGPQRCTCTVYTTAHKYKYTNTDAQTRVPNTNIETSMMYKYGRSNQIEHILNQPPPVKFSENDATQQTQYLA